MKGRELLGQPATNPPVAVHQWAWATVTDDAPLRVQLDTDDAPLPVTPDTLVAGLAINDRVWIQLVTNDNPLRRHHRLVIIGRGGG